MDRISKQQRIKDDLKQRINDKEFLSGTKIPAENSLMNEYKVSRHTIRAAIDALVQEGLLEKKQGSGTYVKEVRLPKKGEGGKTIGVLTTYLSDYIFPSIIRGIEETINAEGYSMMVATTQNNWEKERQQLERMMRQGIDGLIIEPTKSALMNPNLSLLLELRRSGIPFVYLHSSYPEIEAPIVEMDDREATKLATEHLLELGHTTLGMVTKMDDAQGRRRLKGFLAALESHHGTVGNPMIATYETETISQLPETIATLLSGENRPTALVVYNDEVASLVDEVAHEKNILIPEELSVISHDASGFPLKYARMAVTSMRHPKEQMGEAAARALLQLIQTSGSTNVSKEFQSELVTGNTTASP